MQNRFQNVFWKGGTQLNKKVETKDLFECKTSYLKELFEGSKYPWDMLSKIKEYANKLIEEGIDEYNREDY